MVKLFRVDDRLIHGQVAVYWVSATAADTIVVANDKHATNAMMKMSLTVGKPAGVKMEVLTLADAVDYINNPANEKKKMMVVVGSAPDAGKIAKECPEITEVNIGGIRHGEGRVSVALQVFLSEEDMAELRAIKDLGKTVYLQEIPSKPKLSFEEICSNYDKNK